jgi:hypothetical protein
MQKPDSPQNPFNDLIPELRDWNGGKGVDAEAWISMVGRYDLAIGYSLIFWPRFVAFDGYVLRDGFSEESVRGFEEATQGNRAAVEAVVNHLHVVDIHGNEPLPAEAQIRFLGRVLKSIYEVKLKADFPDRSFVVEFNDQPDLDPIEYEVTFYQA